jgi:hypothetical protein
MRSPQQQPYKWRSPMLETSSSYELPSMTEGTSEPPVSELLDSEVLELADSKMNEAQNQRLGDLQTKGKTAGLTDAERYELLALLQIYQLGQLRKSEALAEAIHRRLREPLAA